MMTVTDPALFSPFPLDSSGEKTTSLETGSSLVLEQGLCQSQQDVDFLSMLLGQLGTLPFVPLSADASESINAGASSTTILPDTTSGETATLTVSVDTTLSSREVMPAEFQGSDRPPVNHPEALLSPISSREDGSDSSNLDARTLPSRRLFLPPSLEVGMPDNNATVADTARFVGSTNFARTPAAGLSVTSPIPVLALGLAPKFAEPPPNEAAGATPEKFDPISHEFAPVRASVTNAFGPRVASVLPAPAGREKNIGDVTLPAETSTQAPAGDKSDNAQATPAKPVVSTAELPMEKQPNERIVAVAGSPSLGTSWSVPLETRDRQPTPTQPWPITSNETARPQPDAPRDMVSQPAVQNDLALTNGHPTKPLGDDSYSSGNLMVSTPRQGNAAVADQPGAPTTDFRLASLGNEPVSATPARPSIPSHQVPNVTSQSATTADATSGLVNQPSADDRETGNASSTYGREVEDLRLPGANEPNHVVGKPPQAVEAPTTTRAVESAAPVSFVDQISGQVGGRLDDLRLAGRLNLQMDLQPPELGRMHLDLTLEDGKLHVRFVVQDHAAKQLLDQQMEPLRERFAEVGVQLGEFDVRSDGGAPRRDPTALLEQSAGPRRGLSRQMRAYSTSTRSLGLVDVIA